MRRNKRITMAGWMGLAALGALQYMGPRPLFVKTAYAGPAVVDSASATTDRELPFTADAAQPVETASINE